MIRRALAAAALAAVALPALAYLLPVPSILRRAAERRAAQSLASLDVSGTLQADGDSAAAVLEAGGVRGAGGLAAVPARVQVKVPGRCRVELVPPGQAEADRTFVLVKGDAVTGEGALARDPALVALARGTCALLALPREGEDGDRPWAASLQRRGVALSGVALGRFDGRIAWVIGGRPTEAHPLAWFDKESFQPVRLSYVEGKVPADVRLLGWGSPTGGDWFPRAVEVHVAGALRIRFTTEKATANPRLADALFQ